MVHLCNTKQNENASSQDFLKRWRELSYKCLDAPLYKAIVGLCKNNLKARSHIVGVGTKTMARLIEAAPEAEGIFAELKKNSPKEEPSSSMLILFGDAIEEMILN